ncbi:MAG: hypothetical protein CMB37_01180 [Euryarchaeota archaeon]|nr:hypothetical protein [Euryarchaeota archaeon]
MIDPRIVVEVVQKGDDYSSLLEDSHSALVTAEFALAAGLDNVISQLTSELGEAELEFLLFRKSQMNNDAALASEHLTNALNHSRNQSNRSHLLEARIRMEWGLLRYSQGEEVEAGVDLRWAVERLGALNEGHPWHGLALLNMATWHTNRGEYGMALAMYSEIRRESPHSVEIIAISRRRAAELFMQKNHNYTALRNLWVAHHGFRDCKMKEEAIESGLHWIDVGLEHVSDNAATMEQAITNASPRSIGEKFPNVAINRDDLRYMVDWLNEQECADETGLLDEAIQTLQS